MATRMQQRRGTAAQWISVNNGSGPILAAGEIGFESDTNKFKIGDGVNHWVDLTYFTDAASVLAALNNLTDGAPDLLNTLNEIAAALGDDPNFFSTVATNLSNHEADTTNVHGIADTTQLATISYVDGAVNNVAATLPSADGIGLTWNADTEQLDVDGSIAGYGTVWDPGSGTININGNIVAKVSDVASIYAPKDAPTFTNLVTADEINTAALSVDNNLIANNVTIEGNLTVAGTQSIVNSTNLAITDNIIYLNEAISKTITAAVGNGTSVTYTVDNADSSYALGNIVEVTGITPSSLNVSWTEITGVTATSFTVANTSTDTYVSGGSAASKAAVNPDLGFVGGYSVGGNYAHAGFVKDASSGVWKIFEGVVPEPSGSIDFTTYTKGNLEVGQIVADSAIIGDVTNFEIQTLAGIDKTLSIQGHLDLKANSVAPSLEDPTITITNGNLVIDPVILGRLHGITSPVQDQLDTKITMDDLNAGLAPKASLTDLGLKADITALDAHAALSLNVHGIADTSALVTNDILAGYNNDIWDALNTKAAVDGQTFTGTVVLPSTTSIGDVSSTEISYVNGVTSAIQTQLNAKAAASDLTSHESATTSVHGIADTAALATKSYADNAVSTHEADTTNVHGIADTSKIVLTTDTGTVTSAMIANGTIVDADINASAAIAQSKISGLTSDLAAKAPLADPTFTGTVVLPSTTSIGNVSATEIGYVDGVTSAIQTQLDAKAPKAAPTFTGTTTTADLTVTGNLTVNGTTTTVSSTNLEVTDPLIYIGTGNSANTKDLGVVGHFNDGTYQHTGIVRDATDGKWKLFAGVTTEPTDTIDFTTWTKSTLVLGTLEADSATIGNVSNTELQYLDGVTSAIQTQINAKAPIASPTFTGTVTVASSGITFSDGTVQTVAATPSLTPINAQTASITLGASFVKDSFVKMNVASANTITIPTDATYNYPVGASIDFQQAGAGQTSFVAASGVTFEVAQVNGVDALKFRGKFSVATALKTAANTWAIFGDLTN